MVLAEEPLCRKCSEAGLVVPATEVDHIIPMSEGGMNARKNLQPLCKECHSTKTALEDGRWTGSKTTPPSCPVTIVCGPPGSGKTSYVKQRTKWGDLVVDMDALFSAISGLELYEKPQALLPFAAEARDAVIERLTRRNQLRRAWIITSGASLEERERLKLKLGAEVIILEVSAVECLRRIQADPRRKHRGELWRPLVERWWREYRRGEGDTRIAA